ncbi:MAG: tRNA (adenosine(37)-N6)-threonylcarbamoyltransferase complex dimerization subunit type 1 TsaB [Thermodesulfovibrionia bacterium]|nr:MAG: tRNA (adenosine(37)-N6)-threonylcarbamoyltransferase complex dimerization subunit type 1 TsaB [Thermodesulfovibrionia bacterium]
MKVLALETATMAGSIAIVSADEGLIGEIKINVKIAHAERLMKSIDWVLNASTTSINKIDAFAVSIGPGSFTGLRIGLSTAKGFSYATNKPLIPVSTLDAFARTLPFCSHLICPMLDARKNEVYTGLYKWEGGICRKIIPETAAIPLNFLKDIKKFYALKKIKEPTVFMGEGIKIYKKIIMDTLKTNASFAPASAMSPSASSVAEIAIEKLKKGISTDPVSLTPFYIRKSEAEVHWKE